MYNAIKPAILGEDIDVPVLLTYLSLTSLLLSIPQLIILTPPETKVKSSPTEDETYLFLFSSILPTVIEKSYNAGYLIVLSDKGTPLCPFPDDATIKIPYSSLATLKISLRIALSVSPEKLLLTPPPVSLFNLTMYSSHSGATPKYPLPLSLIPIIPAT